MTLLEQYKNGETKEVYVKIQKLGQDAFLSENFSEVEAVLTETFERVAYNLEVIFMEFMELNYFRLKAERFVIG
jgi:hypothetical protein